MITAMSGSTIIAATLAAQTPIPVSGPHRGRSGSGNASFCANPGTSYGVVAVSLSLFFSRDGSFTDNLVQASPRWSPLFEMQLLWKRGGHGGTPLHVKDRTLCPGARGRSRQLPRR